MAKLISTNPAKGYELIGEVEISNDSEIKEKVELAHKAKLGWKELGIKRRIEILRAIYKEFMKRKDEFPTLMTKEMGKPISQSEGCVDAFLEEFKWFLDNGEKALAEEITHQDEKSIHKIVYEPWGVAAVITPWNFPLGMFIWGTVPNLIAGNTVIFKISEECPLTGKLIEEIMNSKNLPEGVFSEIYGDGKVGQKLVDSDINLIWFTGSSKVGQHLYQIAAKKFVKAVLEMGGSSPAIIFGNADLSKTIPSVYAERFTNCGQVCDSVKRLIVHESVFDEVVKKLKEEVENKIVGDPLSRDTKIGCLVAKRQLELLQEQVQDAIDNGAKVITGGKIIEDLNGAFYAPTILTNVNFDMKVWKEEVFGPVLPIVPFKTEEQAIKLANDTIYGLGSRVYTNDLECARRVAAKIKAGTVEINCASRWLCCNPFGGYKLSGMGREHGTIGFRELCQVKVISE